MLFEGGFAPRDLGTLPGYDVSEAVGINSDEVIVGNCAKLGGGTFTSFVYRSGKMTDLNTALVTDGWTIQYVVGINNEGQIAATASSAQFPYGHAVRLNPECRSDRWMDVLERRALGKRLFGD